MRFRQLVVGVVFIAIAAMAARVSVGADTFWHLAAGRWIWDQGELLRADPFSITRMGQAWQYPGWLAQLLLLLFYEILGLIGLNIFTLLQVLATFALLWRAMGQSELLRGFVLVLAAAASAIFWSARPQMFTLLFSSSFLVLLEHERRVGSSRRIWILPLIMILWVNIHGGFIAGFLIIFAFLGGQFVEFVLSTILGAGSRQVNWVRHRDLIVRFSGLLILCLAAVVINPFGPQMFLYPFKTISIETLANYIQEWQSPDFHQPNTWPFAAMLLGTATSFALSQKKLRANELFLFLGFAGLALHSARNIALFAVGSALPLARHLDSAIKPIAERVGSGKELSPRLAAVLNWLVIILLAIALPIWAYPRMSTSATNAAISEQFPVEAVDFLTGQNEPVTFHSYRWGGYLLWRDWPNMKSFVDGRTDLFGDEILEEYLSIYRAEFGFEDRLRKWSIEWVLVEPTAPLAATAERLGWPNPVRTPVGNLYHIK